MSLTQIDFRHIFEKINPVTLLSLLNEDYKDRAKGKEHQLDLSGLFQNQLRGRIKHIAGIDDERAKRRREGSSDPEDMRSVSAVSHGGKPPALGYEGDNVPSTRSNIDPSVFRDDPELEGHLAGVHDIKPEHQTVITLAPTTGFIDYTTAPDSIKNDPAVVRELDYHKSLSAHSPGGVDSARYYVRKPIGKTTVPVKIPEEISGGRDPVTGIIHKEMPVEHKQFLVEHHRGHKLIDSHFGALISDMGQYGTHTAVGTMSEEDVTKHIQEHPTHVVNRDKEGKVNSVVDQEMNQTKVLSNERLPAVGGVLPRRKLEVKERERIINGHRLSRVHLTGENFKAGETDLRKEDVSKLDTDHAFTFTAGLRVGITVPVQTKSTPKFVSKPGKILSAITLSKDGNYVKSVLDSPEGIKAKIDKAGKEHEMAKAAFTASKLAEINAAGGDKLVGKLEPLFKHGEALSQHYSEFSDESSKTVRSNQSEEGRNLREPIEWKASVGTVSPEEEEEKVLRSGDNAIEHEAIARAAIGKRFQDDFFKEHIHPVMDKIKSSVPGSYGRKKIADEILGKIKGFVRSKYDMHGLSQAYHPSIMGHFARLIHATAEQGIHEVGVRNPTVREPISMQLKPEAERAANREALLQSIPVKEGPKKQPVQESFNQVYGVQQRFAMLFEEAQRKSTDYVVVITEDEKDKKTRQAREAAIQGTLKAGVAATPSGDVTFYRPNTLVTGADGRARAIKRTVQPDAITSVTGSTGQVTFNTPRDRQEDEESPRLVRPVMSRLDPKRDASGLSPMTPGAGDAVKAGKVEKIKETAKDFENRGLHEFLGQYFKEDKGTISLNSDLIPDVSRVGSQESRPITDKEGLTLGPSKVPLRHKIVAHIGQIFTRLFDGVSGQKRTRLQGLAQDKKEERQTGVKPGNLGPDVVTRTQSPDNAKVLAALSPGILPGSSERIGAEAATGSLPSSLNPKRAEAIDLFADDIRSGTEKITPEEEDWYKKSGSATLLAHPSHRIARAAKYAADLDTAIAADSSKASILGSVVKNKSKEELQAQHEKADALLSSAEEEHKTHTIAQRRVKTELGRATGVLPKVEDKGSKVSEGIPTLKAFNLGTMGIRRMFSMASKEDPELLKTAAIGLHHLDFDTAVAKHVENYNVSREDAEVAVEPQFVSDKKAEGFVKVEGKDVLPEVHHEDRARRFISNHIGKGSAVIFNKAHDAIYRPFYGKQMYNHDGEGADYLSTYTAAQRHIKGTKWTEDTLKGLTRTSRQFAIGFIKNDFERVAPAGTPPKDYKGTPEEYRKEELTLMAMHRRQAISMERPKMAARVAGAKTEEERAAHVFHAERLEHEDALLDEYVKGGFEKKEGASVGAPKDTSLHDQQKNLGKASPTGPSTRSPQ